MSKIVFFGLPAYGHFNPTLEIVRELVNRGNEVWYYSFHQFQEKIECNCVYFKRISAVF